MKLTSLLLAFAAATLFAPSASAQPAAPDPAAEARAAAQRCSASARERDRERSCYEAAILARLRESGAGAALALLGRLAEIDEDVRREGHMYAHGIGILALTDPAEVGPVFASCTPSFQSGCYHGVIQSYFLAVQRRGGEMTTATVDALCADHREPDGSGRLLFQCTHGLGHGLVIFHRYDLPRALASCDLLSREWERESCYGGAFMENVVNATHPHHALASHGSSPEPEGHGAGHDAHAGHGGGGHDAHAGHGSGGHDAHAGHGGGHDAHGQHGGGDHGDSAPATAWRALDPNDLHYPCSVMEEKYRDGCYTIQTAAMLHHTGQDWRRTAEECGRAPEAVRTTCFVSLGRDVSSLAAPDPSQGARLCGYAEPAYQPACTAGVVTSLVNLEADPTAGLPFCRAVASVESKRACYRAIGQQASGLADGAARRAEACGRAEPDYVQVCLTGFVAEEQPAPSADG